jgi:hypothetical protein
MAPSTGDRDPDNTLWEMGAHLRYVPSYSPDFNPIELAFAKLKAFLRTARPLSFDHVSDLVPRRSDSSRQSNVAMTCDPEVIASRLCYEAILAPVEPRVCACALVSDRRWRRFAQGRQTHLACSAG